MQATFQMVVGYILGLLIILVIAGISLKPIKFMVRLLINSAVGALLLFVINFVGKYVGISIGINAITSLVVGVLGIFGVILILILQIFF